MSSTPNLKKCMMISNLPDKVLVHILSFLPTQCAIRTCILSSRWKNLWREVVNLDFRPIKTDMDYDERWRYVDFIERVIMSRESKINKFYFDCNALSETYNFSKFEAWISKVVDRDVQDICIVGFDRYMQLPQKLFTCKTLVSLKLVSRDIQCVVPSSIHLPSLKVLHLKLSSPSSVLTQKLFCSSPLLEDLYIHVDYTDPDSRLYTDCDSEEHLYNISSPFLKKLFIKIDKRNYDFKYVVNVDAPVLESLEVQLVPFVEFSLKNSPDLIKARLVYYETGRSFVGEIIKLLESVSYVKELSLGGHLSIPVFGVSSQKEWPAFPFVTHLTTDIFHVQFDLTTVPTWNIFPVLKYLRLNFYGSCSFKYFLKILSYIPNLSTLVINKRLKSYELIDSEQDEVPMCLSSYVKEIKLIRFNGSSSEMQIVKYLLESAKALENLTFSMCDNDGRKGNDLLNKIVMLPGSSKQVQFLFN